MRTCFIAGCFARHKLLILLISWSVLLMAPVEPFSPAILITQTRTPNAPSQSIPATNPNTHNSFGLDGSIHATRRSFALQATTKGNNESQKKKKKKNMAADIPRNSGRKRSHGETSPVQMVFPFMIQALRLEAIFYPKFENETGERSIRKQMISDSDGYLEVSTKHSGSLLLWSGGSRFYSKNSYHNVFTSAGEILLRQHFQRVQENDNNNSQTDLFQACSDYVEQHRLTLSFEAVTTVLGDHGDRPRHDFLILTAVADRNTKDFYSSSQLIAFAQDYRLPHNDFWIFRESDAKLEFFALFDDARETGTASTVIPRLTEAATTYIPCMYPHSVFQGDIMEGIVIRNVGDATTATSEHGRSTRSLQELAERAQEVVLSDPQTTEEMFSLRKLRQHAPDNEEFHGKMQQQLGSYRSVQRFPPSTFDAAALTSHLLDSPDMETALIAKLIKKLSDMTQQFKIAISCATTEDGQSQYIAIVHVLYDTVFQKYHRQREEGELPLFRGFSFEIIGDAKPPSATTSSTTPMEIDVEDSKGQKTQEKEVLMLKMKFLPYMVRTFGCRNGLRTIRNDGPEAFAKYSGNLLIKWGISDEGRRKWLPFFRGWGHYASQCMEGNPPEAAKDLDPLTDSNYLDHIAVYTKLYESGTLEISNPKSSSLRGLVVVVSLDISVARHVADYIAKELAADRIDGISSITPDLMLQAQQAGYVCSLSVSAGFGSLPSLLKKHGDFVNAVLFQCSEDDIDAALLPKSEEKSVIGKLKAWRNKPFHALFDLPRSSLFPSNESSMDVDEDKVEASPSEEFRGMMVSFAQNQIEVDERPGLLAFFPGIPGCGKSACSSLSESEVQCGDRKMTILAGDKTPGKYWPTLRRKRLEDSPGVVIADKNAPAGIWSTVGGICASTRAVAVPVIPDALQTTRIHGLRKTDGSIEDDKVHVYPFSLEFLAVCIARVLARESGTHDGKLDVSTKRAAMIVVKFFSLYRRHEATDMADTIKEVIMIEGGTCSDPIMVPFFSESRDQKLPAAVESILVEALRCQFGYDHKKEFVEKSRDPYIDDLEDRIRECIKKHKDDLLQRTVSLARSRQLFVTEIEARLKKLDSEPPTPVSEVRKAIKLTSIDVTPESVHKIVLDQRPDPKFSDFLQTIVGDADIEVVLGDKKAARKHRFVPNTHITLAFSGEVDQDEMRRKYAGFIGKTVKFHVEGLYWSERIMALGVIPDSFTIDGDRVSLADKPFVHITTWFCDGAKAFEANKLRDLYDAEKAERIDLGNETMTLEGVMSFWEASKSSRS